MNIRKFLATAGILFVSLILLLTVTIRVAQSGQMRGPSTDVVFQRYDTDDDKKLTLEEFPGPDDHFSQYDKNDDGYIEKDNENGKNKNKGSNAWS